MQYTGPIRYVVSYGNELMFLIAGVVVGMILMAIIDYIVDQLHKPKIELTVYKKSDGHTKIMKGDWRDE